MARPERARVAGKTKFFLRMPSDISKFEAVALRQPFCIGTNFNHRDLYEGYETFSLQKHPLLWASDVSLSNCFGKIIKRIGGGDFPDNLFGGMIMRIQPRNVFYTWFYAVLLNAKSGSAFLYSAKVSGRTIWNRKEPIRVCNGDDYGTYGDGKVWN